jgi:hypothetical protein
MRRVDVARVTFVGHFHRWLSATPEGIIPWNGNEMITG